MLIFLLRNFEKTNYLTNVKYQTFSLNYSMKQVNFFPTRSILLSLISKVDFKQRGIFSSWKIRGILERRIGHHVDEEREPRFRLYTFSRYPDRGETCPFFLLFQFKFFTWNTNSRHERVESNVGSTGLCPRASFQFRPRSRDIAFIQLEYPV